MKRLGRIKKLFNLTLTTGLVFIALSKYNVVSAACPGTQIDTALGPVCGDAVGITNFTLRLLIGIGMGIAVFKGTFAIWKWRNSESPDKKQEALRELMAVFTGLVLLFIGIPILAFIGIDILDLGQYGGTTFVDIFR